ncbi:SipW-dependent-type signal peptide-containing protein, partial [Candidatus Woesebacteria bacterium]|nr:SipW-dependent-type signal peptide-containing protein [Candidatus Woesebacteria bacterium]
MKKRMVFALTALCLVVGVAYAYFTSVKTLNIGSFGTATLEIELASETTGSADTLLPGESVQVGWSATNSGDRELHLMGSINPTFVDSSLDSSYLTVESIERNNAGVWEPVQVSSEGVFFYSDDGSESNLLSLLP